jgi:hypothetical protein
MRYLKKFNEMLDPMGSWNPNQLDDKHEDEEPIKGVNYQVKNDPTYRYGRSFEDDPDEVCTGCDCIPCQCTDEEYDEDLREDNNRGTFGYFNTMTKEELLDYQKNFEHDFENPAEHDPEYVAWKKACEIKGCFDKEPFYRSRKESEFPSRY